MARLAPVDDILAVLGVGTQGASVGTAVEAFGYLFGCEPESGFEAFEEGGGWAHAGVSSG